MSPVPSKQQPLMTEAKPLWGGNTEKEGPGVTESSISWPQRAKRPPETEEQPEL